MDLPRIQKDIETHFNTQYRNGACRMTLTALAYPPGSCEDSHPCFYPYNTLRNRAMLLVETEAILMMDIDFLPSDSLHAYSKGGLMQEVLKATRASMALVIPAFGHTALDTAAINSTELSTLLSSKHALVQAYQSGQLPGFYENRSPTCQAATNISRWLTATVPYQVAYAPVYEPYVIVGMPQVPWYDERFVGYNRDKTQHIEHLSGLGFVFSVLPDVFVIHRVHQLSHRHNDQQPWFYNRNSKLADEISIEISRGTFAPTTTFCTAKRRHT
jgi:hypothetical protein